MDQQRSAEPSLGIWGTLASLAKGATVPAEENQAEDQRAWSDEGRKRGGEQLFPSWESYVFAPRIT